MKKIIFAIALLLVLLIAGQAIATDCADIPTCTGSNNWKYFQYCPGNYIVGGLDQYCDRDSIKTKDGYALLRTTVAPPGGPGTSGKWYFYSPIGTYGSWMEVSDPASCGPGIGVYASDFKGFDKTTSSTYPFVTVYGFYSITQNKWAYSVMGFTPASSCSGCSCWHTLYYWTAANGMDFTQNTPWTFACVHNGAGYATGSSTDAECYLGGMKQAVNCGGTECFQVWGIRDSPGGDAMGDSGGGVKGVFFNLDSNYKVYAGSSGASTNSIYELTSVASNGQGSWTARSSGTLGSYGDLWAMDTSSTKVGWNYDSGSNFLWTGSSFSSGNSPGSVYDAAIGMRSGSATVWVARDNQYIYYLSPSSWGSGGFSTDTCTNSGTWGVDGIDYDTSSNTGWAAVNTGFADTYDCRPYAYGRSVPSPPVVCNCTNDAVGWGNTGLCGISGCSAFQVSQTRSCAYIGGFPCGSQQRCVSPSDAGYSSTYCGNEVVRCLWGGGSNGIYGQNWWIKGYIGSEPTLPSTCPTSATPFPVNSVVYGNSLTITTKVFHYLNAPGTVTIKFHDKTSDADVYTYVTSAGAVTGTNTAGGKLFTYTLSNLAAWQATPLCPGRNYTVSVSVEFRTTGDSPNRNWWAYSPFEMRTTGSNPGGSSCGGCSCDVWLYNNCGGLDENGVACATPTPRLQTRSCWVTGGGSCVGTPIKQCIADSNCGVEVCGNYLTPLDCGSAGCGQTELPKFCANGYTNYSKCFYNSTCDVNCSAWVNQGCGGTYCTFGSGFGNVSAKMLQTRTCNVRPGDAGPSDITYQCVVDGSCACNATAFMNKTCGGSHLPLDPSYYDPSIYCTPDKRLWERASVSPLGCAIVAECRNDTSCVAPVANFTVESQIVPNPAVFNSTSVAIKARFTSNASITGNITVILKRGASPLFSYRFVDLVPNEWSTQYFDVDTWGLFNSTGENITISTTGIDSDGQTTAAADYTLVLTEPSAVIFVDGYATTTGGGRVNSSFTNDATVNFATEILRLDHGLGRASGTLNLEVCKQSNSSDCPQIVNRGVYAQACLLGCMAPDFFVVAPDWDVLVPGSYIVTGIVSLGSAGTYMYTYNFTVVSGTYSVGLNIVPNPSLYGEDVTFSVTPNNPAGLDNDVSILFYDVNDIFRENPLDTWVVGTIVNGNTQGYLFNNWAYTNSWLIPGKSYKVCARAIISGCTEGCLTPALNCENDWTVNDPHYTLTLTMDKTKTTFGEGVVNFVLTPTDSECSGGCKTSKVTLYSYNDRFGRGTLYTWDSVPSGTAKTFILDSSNWVASGLKELNTYGIYATAEFGPSKIERTTPKQYLYVGTPNYDQTGFAPIRADVIGTTLFTRTTQESMIFYGNSATGPYICSVDEDLLTQKHCYYASDLEIDVLSGVIAVDGPSGDISARKRIIYTGYEQISDTEKVGKFGIIDPTVILGNPVTPVVLSSQNPAETQLTCLSNPVQVHCPREGGTYVQVGFSSGFEQRNTSTSGGEFAFIYNIGDDAYYSCFGSDGVRRGPLYKINNWVTAFSDALYAGACMVKGGLTAVDTNKDGFEEIIGGGGIIDVKHHTISNKFGVERSIVPVDVNGDGFIDFVSQSNGVMEMWPGTPEYKEGNVFSNNLTVTALQPCQVDQATGRLILGVIAVGPTDPNTWVYTADFGDGTQSSRHDNTWSANNGYADKWYFNHDYEKTGTFTVTGLVTDSASTASSQCTVSVSSVPSYYNFTGGYTGLCDIAGDGLFTTYSDSVTNHNWVASSSTSSIVGTTNGLALTNSKFVISHDVRVDSTNPSVKFKFKTTSNLMMDVAYASRSISTEQYSNLMMVRVENNKLYYVSSGGSVSYLIDLLPNTLYDVQVEYVSIPSNGTTNIVNVYAGLQGNAVFVKSFVAPSSLAFDLFYGKVVASYNGGLGYLNLLDFVCTGVEQIQRLPDNEINKILRDNGGDTGPLANCVDGQPNFFNYGNQSGGTFFDDPNRVMYNHSRNPDAYPNVGAYCGSTKMHGDNIRGICDYKDLKVSIQKYPACFKESMNYCVDVLYPAQAGINQGSTEGVLACTTILMSSSFYDQAAAPTMNWVVDLILENWFIIVIVVLVILIGASFAGNKRR